MKVSYHRGTETQRNKFEAENKVTEKIIKSAIEVHRYLGPGLLESIYEECLCKEFELNSIKYLRKKKYQLCIKEQL